MLQVLHLDVLKVDRVLHLSPHLMLHYYIKFTGGGRFGFPAAGKAVRRGLQATVNRGLTAAGGFARRG